jgi:hypothetical protein
VSTIDYDALAIEWCKYVNGTTIFPKLPVYLKQHHTVWQKNQRIKDALAKIQPSIDSLNAMFETPAYAHQPEIDAAAAAARAVATAYQVVQHIALPQPPPAMMAARADAIMSVAGMHVGAALNRATRHVTGRKRGRDRKPDGEKRVRTCAVCREGTDLYTRQHCPGRVRQDKCTNR